MSRRANLAHRCVRCMMHISLCVCSIMPRIETITRVVLVIHRAEVRKPTNTGHLATHCLVNSEVHIRGRENEPSRPITFASNAQPVLLFPHETETISLDAWPFDHARPVTLVVPDGNWRQASKVRARVPGLRHVPCVHLPQGAPSLYRLRSEAHDTGLATIEAIARALEILEGKENGPPVRAALEHLFRAMVERTLWVRGSITADEVTGGIPEGVVKHEPRSGGASSSATTTNFTTSTTTRQS
jgi:DTW domain-containing protein YfiP